MSPYAGSFSDLISYLFPRLFACNLFPIHSQIRWDKCIYILSESILNQTNVSIDNTCPWKSHIQVTWTARFMWTAREKKYPANHRLSIVIIHFFGVSHDSATAIPTHLPLPYSTYAIAPKRKRRMRHSKTDIQALQPRRNCLISARKHTHKEGPKDATYKHTSTTSGKKERKNGGTAYDIWIHAYAERREMENMDFVVGERNPTAT